MNGRLRVWTGLVLLLGLATPVLAADPALVPAALTGDMAHRMMLLALQLGLILLSAKICNLLFEAVRLPGTVGEIVAGMLIGPYALGAVPLPGFPQGALPFFSAAFPLSPELYGVACLAAMILLFMTGLGTDVQQFVQHSLTGSLVGLGGAVAAFAAGAYVGHLFLPGLQHGPLSCWAAPCLFLGILSATTSLAVASRVLAARRKQDTPEGFVIVAGASVDDLIGLILLVGGLGIIASVSDAGDIRWGRVALTAGKVGGVWLAVSVLGWVAARWLQGLLRSFRHRGSLAAMSLGVALILAGLFEEADLALIVGAYVTGLALSRTDIRLAVREYVDPLYTFFVPVFFAVAGMLINVPQLLTRPVAFFALLFLGWAVVAKLVGAALPALACGFNLRGALRIGFGMVPRGELALIVAGVGLLEGFINGATYSAAAAAVVATMVLGPAFVSLLFRNPASGLWRSRAANEAAETTLSFPFPSSEAACLLVQKLQNALEAEGFALYTVDHDEHLYQFRKERSVIDFQQLERELRFTCDRRDTALINTVVIESFAQIEQTVNELRKTLDHAGVGRQVQEPGAPLPNLVALKRFITPDVLCPRLQATDKLGVINELIALLARNGLVKNAAAARDAVMAREASMSTGIQFGLAIPHGRTDAVDHLVCAIGLKPQGLDFASMDKQPTRICVLTLAPQTATAPYMQFMSIISQTLTEQGREALLACVTREEMYTVLTGGISAQQFLNKRQSALRERARQAPAVHPRESPLLRYLKPELMKVDLKGTDKPSIIDELIELLVQQHAVKDREVVRQAIMDREAQMSTGLEHGVAIPHARMDGIEDMLCAIGVKREGVDFASLDGQPANIFIMTVSPRKTPAPQVQFMALMSRLLDENNRRRVLEAPTNTALYELLTAHREP